MGNLLFGPLAAQAQHAAFGHQGLDAGHTEFTGFFDQPVHAVIGGHTQREVHHAFGFALGCVVRADKHLHIAASHVGDGRLIFAIRLAVKEGDGVAGLQAQHLHMARWTAGQIQRGASLQRRGNKEAGHWILL